MTRDQDRGGSADEARGHSIVVLGAAGGIGAETRRLAEADGHRVTGVDRSGDGAVGHLISDVNSTDDRVALLGQLPDKIDFIACAIGSPGTGTPASVLGDNFLGPASILTDLYPRIPPGGGIVLVASVSSTFRRIPESEWRVALAEGPPWRMLVALSERYSLDANESYRFAKMTLKRWGRELAASSISRGVRVNLVSPGAVSTPAGADYVATVPRRSVERGRAVLGRDGTPSEVAGLITYLLYGRGSSWISGLDVPVDGGLMNYLEVRRHNATTNGGPMRAGF